MENAIAAVDCGTESFVIEKICTVKSESFFGSFKLSEMIVLRIRWVPYGSSNGVASL